MKTPVVMLGVDGARGRAEVRANGSRVVFNSLSAENAPALVNFSPPSLDPSLDARVEIHLSTYCFFACTVDRTLFNDASACDI